MESEVEELPAEMRGHWRCWSVRDLVEASLDPSGSGSKDGAGLYVNVEATLVSAWAEVLPSRTSVRYLVSWRGANTQRLVDSVFKMTWLERLCFGRLSARDLSNIQNLARLECLCIHQLSGDKDLTPIGQLSNLEILEIGLNKSATDLDWLGNPALSKLRSLIVYGNQTRFNVPSLEPFTELSSAELISIPSVRPADASLAPLMDLAQLRYLELSKNQYDASDISDIEGKGVRVITI